MGQTTNGRWQSPLKWFRHKNPFQCWNKKNKRLNIGKWRNEKYFSEKNSMLNTQSTAIHWTVTRQCFKGTKISIFKSTKTLSWLLTRRFHLYYANYVLIHSDPCFPSKFPSSVCTGRKETICTLWTVENSIQSTKLWPKMGNVCLTLFAPVHIGAKWWYFRVFVYNFLVANRLRLTPQKICLAWIGIEWNGSEKFIFNR